MSMLKRFSAAALLVLLMLAAALPALAQATPTATPEPDPNAQITFPPPVYTLRGQFPIFGTAAIEGQANYFIEFRPIDGPLATGANEAVFFPAILPSTTAVVDDLLGTWDTALVPNGLYELRLTVNVTGETPLTHVVTPLRVENNLDPEIAALLGIGEPAEPDVVVIEPVAPTEPTAVPPTVPPTVDPNPQVTVSGPNANVRSGDSVIYPIVGSLSTGQSAPIVGVSITGSGWYQVRLPNGTIGFMSPTVVTVTGSLANIPRVQPPPPPATPTPVATATPIASPTPLSAANLVAGNLRVNPFPATCAQPFTLSFDVANQGTVVSPPGVVRFTDARAADGQLPSTVDVNFPAINPGQTIAVDATLTTSVFYNEIHRITVTIDPGNVIAETTKGDNVRTVEYTLARGSCP